MARKIEALRGMDDILPGEVEKWQWLEEKARIFFESRGYKEIRTPVLEMTELFSRSVGESSDIVHKEMFAFQDRGERQVALRPEMTASVARCVIEKSLLSQTKSLRLYYLGAMFRAERPQKGRKRQFHQVGIEMVNEGDASADFECIALLHGFLKSLGAENLRLRLNDLGTADDQKKTSQALTDYFSSQKSKLCKDCQWRLEKNVLRIFDCKVPSCQPLIEKAPWEKIAPLGGRFKELAGQLEKHSIPFEVERRLVRGLDYYNGVVFEIAAGGLGAQDAVAGGGRYDRLYEQLGGPAVPCTGFSIGMERLLAVLEASKQNLQSRVNHHRVYVAPLNTKCELLGEVQQGALKLRESGIRLESTPGEVSLSKHLKKANKLGVRYVLILGDEEFKKGSWVLKDMEKKDQRDIPFDGLVASVREVMSL